MLFAKFYLTRARARERQGGKYIHRGYAETPELIEIFAKLEFQQRNRDKSLTRGSAE